MLIQLRCPCSFSSSSLPLIFFIGVSYNTNSNFKVVFTHLSFAGYRSLPVVHAFVCTDMKEALLHALLRKIDKTLFPLQINGENYFLPKDVELNLAAADIMDSCLNINKLIKDLSDKALVCSKLAFSSYGFVPFFPTVEASLWGSLLITPLLTKIIFPCYWLFFYIASYFSYRVYAATSISIRKLSHWTIFRST